MKAISKVILKIMGWKINCDIAINFDKAILVVAPHTSSFDFWIGRLTFWCLKLPIKFIVKKEFFRFPYGFFLRIMGGVPVDREKSAGAIEQINKYFEDNEQVFIAITPEGTRKYNNNWKKGFYYIALRAKVPIILCYLDYAKKEGGMGEVLMPGGNIDQDMAKINNFYENVTARYPEKFNLSPMYKNKTKNKV